jgi:hypothetical protein
MFYVYFARGYANEQKIAECATLDAAVSRADEEFNNGARDIQVFDHMGEVAYEPTEQDAIFF